MGGLYIGNQSNAVFCCQDYLSGSLLLPSDTLLQKAVDETDNRIILRRYLFHVYFVLLSHVFPLKHDSVFEV